MIDIKLETKGTMVSGYIKAKGSEDTIKKEIYGILKTLSEQCPEAFSYAVARHTLDIMEKIENGKAEE